MSTINKPFRKKDAMQLVTGQPVYMDDVIPQDCCALRTQMPSSKLSIRL